MNKKDNMYEWFMKMEEFKRVLFIMNSMTTMLINNDETREKIAETEQDLADLAEVYIDLVKNKRAKGDYTRSKESHRRYHCMVCLKVCKWEELNVMNQCRECRS